MKNKILSVGIAFAFLLMAACSHKGGEVTALNPPPGPDVVKPGPDAAKPSPEQIPSIIVEEPVTPDQPTGITIPPRVTPGSIPPPTTEEPATLSAESIPRPPHSPGRAPPRETGRPAPTGGGATGGSGTGTAANQPPSVTQIDWQFVNDTTHSVFQRGTLDISNPSGANPPPPIPLLLPPTGSELMKLVVIVTATDAEGDTIHYLLKDNGSPVADSTNGNLSTDAFVSHQGQYPLTITVEDAAHPQYFIRAISVQIAPPSTNSPPNIISIDWMASTTSSCTGTATPLDMTHSDISIPSTTSKLCFTVHAEGSQPLIYKLASASSAGPLSQDTSSSGLGNLAINVPSSSAGHYLLLGITVTDSQQLRVSQDIRVFVEPPATGGSSGPTQVEPIVGIFSPQILTASLLPPTLSLVDPVIGGASSQETSVVCNNGETFKNYVVSKIYVQFSDTGEIVGLMASCTDINDVLAGTENATSHPILLGRVRDLNHPTFPPKNYILNGFDLKQCGGSNSPACSFRATASLLYNWGLADLTTWFGQEIINGDADPYWHEEVNQCMAGTALTGFAANISSNINGDYFGKISTLCQEVKSTKTKPTVLLDATSEQRLPLNIGQPDDAGDTTRSCVMKCQDSDVMTGFLASYDPETYYHIDHRENAEVVNYMGIYCSRLTIDGVRAGSTLIEGCGNNSSSNDFPNIPFLTPRQPAIQAAIGLSGNATKNNDKVGGILLYSSPIDFHKNGYTTNPEGAAGVQADAASGSYAKKICPLGYLMTGIATVEDTSVTLIDPGYELAGIESILCRKVKIQ